MGRSGYVDDDYSDNPIYLLWPAIVQRAINGKRGQAFLRELLETLDSMPNKALIAEDLQDSMGAVCAIGSVGARRGIDMSKLDPEDHHSLGKVFDISPTLVREIEFTNDDDFTWTAETPEDRWGRVRKWVAGQIRAADNGDGDA